MMKWCSKCQRDKPILEFYESKDKVDSLCKICRQAYSKVSRPTGYMKIYNATHKEAYKLWVEQNRSRIRAARRARYLRCKDYFKEQDRTRNLYHRGVLKGHTEQDWLTLLEVYEHRCFGCGVQSEKLTRDHILPLSKDGGDEIENIAPLCASCNSKKGTHGPEWYMQKWLIDLETQLGQTD